MAKTYVPLNASRPIDEELRSKEIHLTPYDDFIANKIDGFYTLNVYGRESISNDIQLESLRYRGVVRSVGLPSRIITVEYALMADTSAELLEKFKELRKLLTPDGSLDEDSSFEFSFKDEKAFYEGYLQSMEEVPSESTSVISKFTIVCPEPWKLGEVVRTSGDVMIDTYYPTPPELIQVNITQTTNELEIRSGDFKIVFDPEKTVLNRGDIVRIAPQEGLVYVGDQQSEHLISLTSDFQNFEIMQGQMVTASTGILTVLMRERWL